METNIEMADESNPAKLDVVGESDLVQFVNGMVHHSLVHCDKIK